jgi:6-phospho-beta-glucosidase
MAMPDTFNVAYLGGGSRFVVTLLHGLADHGNAVRDLGRPIELRLLDLDVKRAEEMARYTAIVANATGLPITAITTDDDVRAIDGAHWVLYSIGIRHQTGRLFGQLIEGFGHVEHETGVWTAADAAVNWPIVSRFAALTKQRAAPDATFTSLVNPTDTVPPAIADAFGLQSHGICVEVPNLRYFLSYYLQVPWDEVVLEFIGSNHSGWVTRCALDGRDGVAALVDVIDELPRRRDWHFGHECFLAVTRRLGWMPSANFHAWPFIAPDWEELAADREDWARRMLPAGQTRRDIDEANLQAALASGQMLPRFDSMKHPYGLPPFMYANVGPSMAGLAIGLAGGDCGPVTGPISLQCENGSANPCQPADAWVEAPTLVRRGRLEPQTVPQPPDWLFARNRMIAAQRRLIARWLATGDTRPLTQALYMSPCEAHYKVLERAVRQLPRVAHPDR